MFGRHQADRARQVDASATEGHYLLIAIAPGDSETTLGGMVAVLAAGTRSIPRLGFELVGTATDRWFQIRTETLAAAFEIAALLEGAYPRVALSLRVVRPGRAHPPGDPAWHDPAGDAGPGDPAGWGVPIDGHGDEALPRAWRPGGAATDATGADVRPGATPGDGAGEGGGEEGGEEGGDAEPLRGAFRAAPRPWLVGRRAARHHRAAGHIPGAYAIDPPPPAPPTADPAVRRPGEVVAATLATLARTPALPLNLWQDGDLDPTRNRQGDPLLPPLRALGGLPPGWRLVGQLIVSAADDRWADDYAALALERPAPQLAQQEALAARAGRGGGTGAFPLLALFGGVLVVAIVAQLVALWRRGATGSAVGVGVALAALALGLLVWRLRRPRAPVIDPALVREKLAAACHTQLRLAAFAPPGTPPPLVERALATFAAAYDGYGRPAGNRLAFAPFVPPDGPDALTALGCYDGATMVLNHRELAGLWHLPQGVTGIGPLARTDYPRILPEPPEGVGPRPGALRLGRSRQNLTAIPVYRTRDELYVHTLLVAASRAGKSVTLQRMAEMFVAWDLPLHLYDLHSDLARVVASNIPAALRERVVYLDLADPEWVVGYNPLDVGLGWAPHRLAENAIAAFRAAMPEGFGLRMEPIFANALRTLIHENERIRDHWAREYAARLAAGLVADPREREGWRLFQHTIFDVPRLFTEDDFRERLVAGLTDGEVLAWWNVTYATQDPRVFREYVEPVFSRLANYERHPLVRAILGQGWSTINPREWVDRRRIVIVNGAAGAIGKEAAGLLGSLLLNATMDAIYLRSVADPAFRNATPMIVDEFQTMRGVDYGAILAELGKYGVRLILATQYLDALKGLTVTGDETGTLDENVRTNVASVYAFRCGPRDAEALAARFSRPGAPLLPAQLQGLPNGVAVAQFYRASGLGAPLPPCTFEPDPPTPLDPDGLADVAARSRARYTRPIEAVGQGERRALLERDLDAWSYVPGWLRALRAEATTGTLPAAWRAPAPATPTAPAGSPLPDALAPAGDGENPATAWFDDALDEVAGAAPGPSTDPPLRRRAR
jgi:hypothetical protein